MKTIGALIILAGFPLFAHVMSMSTGDFSVEGDRACAVSESSVVSTRDLTFD